MADQSAPGASRCRELARCASAQAVNLREPQSFDRAYVLRQLALQAVRYGMDGLARELRTRAPEAGLWPVWATACGRPPDLEVGTHDGSVNAVAVLTGERIVSGGGDGRVRLWHLDPPGTPVELGTHTLPVYAVAVAANGGVVSGGDDGRVRLWEPDKCVELATHDGRSGQ